MTLLKFALPALVLAATTLAVPATAGGAATASGSPTPVATSPNTATPVAPAFARPKFIIGVWSQPAYKLQAWADRGINTVVAYEPLGGTNSNAFWSAAAVAANLAYIREPGASFAADAADAHLLAFLQPDEPDVHGTSPAVVASTYAAWKKGAKSVPVMTNFSGGNVLLHYTPQTTYIDYLHSTDWVGSDFYPIAGWGRPDWLDHVAQSVDTLRAWSTGKPQLAYIEATSDISPNRSMNSGVVSPGQFRSMVWSAVAHGVKGIIYFPQGFGGGFVYDSTPPEILAEMKTVNAHLTAIAGTLAGTANPAAGAVTVAAPLEAGWRGTGTSRLLIVVNATDQTIKAASIALGRATAATATVDWENRKLATSNGVLTDDFAPFTTHVYRVTQR